MHREPQRQICNDAQHSGSDCLEGCVGRRKASQPLGQWSACEYPDKRGSKRAPGCHQRAEGSKPESAARPACNEADIFIYEHERTRRRLCQAESIKHLVGCEPAFHLDGLLFQVGKRRVGAAECNDCECRKQPAHTRQGMIRTKSDECTDDRCEPCCSPNRCSCEGLCKRW